MTAEVDAPGPVLTNPAEEPVSMEPGERRPRWFGRRQAVVIGIGLAVVFALVSVRLTPRGPLTSGAAVASMAAALLVGFVGAFAIGRRWTMVALPAVFVVVFELARFGLEGPTVDVISLDSTYGVLAFVVGRLFHGLLVLGPMVLGAAYGLGAAHRVGRAAASERGVLGWSVTVVVTVLFAALAMLLALPASTEAIVGPDGLPVSGSVAALTSVEIGGHELAVMIRGHSVDDPVLLFLAGGPGGSELGAMRRHLAALEENFVVATWDQRGTGRSYHELDPTATLTLDRAVADAVEMAEYLRTRFGEEKIYVVGQSWGSILGVLAVQERPDLFHAFVGVGQMVSPVATDRIFYEDTLAWAREEGATGLVERLTAIGPPPYTDVRHYETALSHEHEVYPYDHSGNAEGEGGMSENLFVPEYAFVEQIHVLGAFLDAFSVLYPQIQDVDLRVDAPSLEVPVYLVQGAWEARGRAEPADEWFAMLDAPSKERFVFDTSGHRSMFEQPALFVDVMVSTVLAETSGSE